MSPFTLKYLAKFICEYDVCNLSINGGPMPMRSVKADQLIELDLRDQGLYSEDLFVLAQALKENRSLTHINLSKNCIGYTYVEERKLLEIKMKNQEKLRDSTFE